METEQMGITRHLFLNEIAPESAMDLVRYIYFINEYDEANEQLIIQDALSRPYLKEDAEIILPEREPIVLEINSLGGELLSGFQIITAIENSETPIIGSVTGMCASMAIPILASCDVRTGTEYSTYMIHDVSSGFSGKHTESRNWLNQQDVLRETMAGIIDKYTKFTKTELLEMFEHNDAWFNVYKAYEKGLIDVMDVHEQVINEEQFIEALGENSDKDNL